MKKYLKPEIDFINLEVQDVLLTSVVVNDELYSDDDPYKIFD